MNILRKDLHRDSKGRHVKNLHKDLCQLGFTISENETDFGSTTEKAVKTFQELYDRDPNGKVDQRTKNLIEENLARIKKLKKIGFVFPNSSPGNEEAYRTFQKKHSLEPNGTLDRLTAKRFDEYLEQIENLKRLGFTIPNSITEIEDEIKAFQKEHKLKQTGVLDDSTIESIEVEEQKQNRSYRSSRLPIFKSASQKQTKSNPKILMDLYSEICNSWRMLTDVRFKLLGFVPTISIVLLINLLAKPKNDEGLSPLSRIIICMIGLFVTIGLYIYDYRNTQLYDDLVSRARRIEMELGVETGQFLGRKKPMTFLIPFQHDIAIKIIYFFAGIAWILALLAIIFNWI